MTVAGKLISLFSLIFFSIGIVTSSLILSRYSFIYFVLFFLGYVYLIPPLIFRIHKKIVGSSPRTSDISAPKYSPWWGGYQIQAIFIAVPSLEGFLKLIPGCYSFWLTLWGSQIGKSVSWTPTVLVSDRDQLIIGDNVIIGHQVQLICHFIRPKKNSLFLTLDAIKIGSNCFIGAGSRIGPGAEIAAGDFLPILSDVYPPRLKAKRAKQDILQTEQNIVS